MILPQFIHPFYCWWMFVLFPVIFCYEQSFYKHYFTWSWLTVTGKTNHVQKTTYYMISFTYSSKHATIMHGVKVRILGTSWVTVTGKEHNGCAGRVWEAGWKRCTIFHFPNLNAMQLQSEEFFSSVWTMASMSSNSNQVKIALYLSLTLGILKGL